MKREAMLARASEPERVWDLLVIGGGATGLGIAVDAAARSHSVLLAERDAQELPEPFDDVILKPVSIIY